MKDFKDFLTRGNVVELAVAVVIGAAFGAVITSFVENMLTPLLAIPGTTDFSDLTFTISGSTFSYGIFLNALIAFAMIAAAIFFIVVRPLNKLAERRAAEEEATTRDCPECKSEIAIDATRCAHCTSQVAAMH